MVIGGFKKGVTTPKSGEYFGYFALKCQGIDCSVPDDLLLGLWLPLNKMFSKAKALRLIV